jgi:hypothetical protein
LHGGDVVVANLGSPQQRSESGPFDRRLIGEAAGG